MRRDSGSALLEAVVALAILVGAGAGALVLASEVTRAVELARSADAALRRASALLDATALWSREDLDRRLGDRPQGPWRMRIERVDRLLYEVELSDTATGSPVLRTSLFRPEPNGDEPH